MLRAANPSAACLLALAAFAPATRAQPENDACSNATLISGSASADFDNAHATTDGVYNGVCCTFAKL